jgi:hypothetical protein
MSDTFTSSSTQPPPLPPPCRYYIEAGVEAQCVRELERLCDAMQVSLNWHCAWCDVLLCVQEFEGIRLTVTLVIEPPLSKVSANLLGQGCTTCVRCLLLTCVICSIGCVARKTDCRARHYTASQRRLSRRLC